MDKLFQARLSHARAIVSAGGIEPAIIRGELPRHIDTTVSEAVVLGLLRQGVSRWLCVLGHGSTDIGEVLRAYATEGLVRVLNVRSEIEAAHAATALRWVRDQKAAVLTSIGPGALQALAASLVPASNGLGVWFLFGDETTEDEGFNMQQVPRHEQHGFLKLCSAMGDAYTLHTPLAVGRMLRRGLDVVDHPHRPGPFYLLLPMNVQPAPLTAFNVDELPLGPPPPLGAAADDGRYAEAARIIREAERVVVRVGGGARHAGQAVSRLLDLSDGVAVTSPLVSGVLPYAHPRNMTVAGSKGSLSGNWAMENADLLISLGSRSVCQSDSSRTAWPGVRHVIAVNTDPRDATHYNRSHALVGEVGATIDRLVEALEDLGSLSSNPDTPSAWLAGAMAKKSEWDAFKAERYRNATLVDPVWGRAVLTQPAAIRVVGAWARRHDAITFFDAGDVQANGFQVTEDDRIGRTFTETGASYMGFATSALLASAMAGPPFYGVALTGDGSFTMNPQILIDGVQHGARGCIVLLDNRRMAAISGLQTAQYGADFATHDDVAVDYVLMARAVRGLQALDGGRSPEELEEALEKAFEHKGLSLVHVPVYWGPEPLGGLGAYGHWNVGSWCDATQRRSHRIGL